MSDQERIERLEFVLGTLISWLHGIALGQIDAAELLVMLANETPVEKRR